MSLDVLLYLTEGLLDGVQLLRRGRKEEELRTNSFDHLTYPVVVVVAGVVKYVNRSGVHSVKGQEERQHVVEDEATGSIRVSVIRRYAKVDETTQLAARSAAS